MIYLILSILVSSSIYIIFRLFTDFKVNNFNAIVFNYVIASIFGFWFIDGPLKMDVAANASWMGWSCGLGIFFIFTFFLMAVSTQRAGIAATTVASKMSLVIPVAVAFVLYSDQVTAGKILGIALALIGVYLSLSKEGSGFSWSKILLPSAVFICVGLVDTIVKYMQQVAVPADEITLFLPIAFGFSAIAGILGLIGKLTLAKGKLPMRDVVGGVILGIPNYFSIYLLIKALEGTGMSSSNVFPINNIGIVVLSILLATVFFKERQSRKNWIGIVASIGAILIIWLAAMI